MGIYMRSINSSVLGRQTLDCLAKDMSKYLIQRFNYSQDQFFDVDYEVLVDSPLQAVEAIYEYFDLELSVEARSAMSLFLEQDRKKIRIHRYCSENYGLTDATIKARFKKYIETFNVQV